jgi:hypothetical protein
MEREGALGRSGGRVRFAVFVVLVGCQGSCAGTLSPRECLLIALPEGSITVVDGETNMGICNAELTATRDGMYVKLHSNSATPPCRYLGFEAIERDLTETLGWTLQARAPGFEDTSMGITVPYDAPSCQVHDVNAVIKMKRKPT